jgi:hypothetical protein
MAKTTAAAPPALPATIGDALRELAGLKKKLEALDAKRQPLADRETAIRAHLLESFDKDQLNGARGFGLAVSIVKSDVPKIADETAFLKFALKPANSDLLKVGVSSPAWRERLADGKTVPGVSTFTAVSLRVSAAKTS